MQLNHRGRRWVLKDGEDTASSQLQSGMLQRYFSFLKNEIKSLDWEKTLLNGMDADAGCSDYRCKTRNAKTRQQEQPRRHLWRGSFHFIISFHLKNRLLITSQVVVHHHHSEISTTFQKMFS